MPFTFDTAHIKPITPKASEIVADYAGDALIPGKFVYRGSDAKFYRAASQTPGERPIAGVTVGNAEIGQIVPVLTAGIFQGFDPATGTGFGGAGVPIYLAGGGNAEALSEVANPQYLVLLGWSLNAYQMRLNIVDSAVLVTAV